MPAYRIDHEESLPFDDEYLEQVNMDWEDMDVTVDYYYYVGVDIGTGSQGMVEWSSKSSRKPTKRGK